MLTAMDEGDTFFTQSEDTGEAVPIERYVCPLCNGRHVRSSEVDASDSELDDMRDCIYE